MAPSTRPRRSGGIDAQADGRKPSLHDLVIRENSQLHNENDRLANRLKQAELIIDVQKSLADSGDNSGDDDRKQDRLMDAVETLALDVGTKSACKALGISRASMRYDIWFPPV